MSSRADAWPAARGTTDVGLLPQGKKDQNMIAGLILAGGRSRRFGSEKAVALLGGESLFARAYRNLAAHCPVVAISAASGSQAEGLAKALGAPVLHDPAGAPDGPLAGVMAGLDWAKAIGLELLATLPCDVPLAPADFVARLGTAAAVVQTPQGVQPLCALWPVSAAEALRATLADGSHPPVRRMLQEIGATFVDFDDAAAFANVNTPQDLAEVERRLSGG